MCICVVCICVCCSHECIYCIHMCVTYMTVYTIYMLYTCVCHTHDCIYMGHAMIRCICEQFCIQYMYVIYILLYIKLCIQYMCPNCMPALRVYSVYTGIHTVTVIYTVIYTTVSVCLRYKHNSVYMLFLHFSTTAKKALPRNTDFLCGNQKRTENLHKWNRSCGIGTDIHI